MKHFPRKLVSAALAAATAASLTLSPLAAVIGTDLHVYDSEIHQGTVLSHGVYWGATANDKRTENYVSYTPGADVTPIVTYGSKVTSKDTVSSAAKNLESQGYRVVAGINGDYYYTSNGVPMGLIVTDGVIRTGYNYTWAIGFMEDGTAIIGDPKLSVKMTYTHTVTETVPAETETPTETETPAGNGSGNSGSGTGTGAGTGNQYGNGAGSVDTGSFIGEAAAKAAALSDAGVSESEVTRLKCELDRDHGSYKYEIEFNVGRTEYEYEVDAYSGAILKAEQDYDD